MVCNCVSIERSTVVLTFLFEASRLFGGYYTSPKQLDQVYEAGMAIISPPPEHLVEFDEKKLAAVKGWLIGTAMNRDQADLARQQAAHADRLPQAMKRPLVGEALEQFWLFGRIANEIIVPAPDQLLKVCHQAA